MPRMVSWPVAVVVMAEPDVKEWFSFTCWVSRIVASG
jgi:hypothetical protein